MWNTVKKNELTHIVYLLKSFLQVHWDIEHDSEEEIPTHCLLDKFHCHSFECQRFSISSFAKATNRNVGVVNYFPSFEI